jgi:hypothetical protein
MPLQGTVLPGDIQQLGIIILIHTMKIHMEPIYHFIRIAHRTVTVFFPVSYHENVTKPTRGIICVGNLDNKMQLDTEQLSPRQSIHHVASDIVHIISVFATRIKSCLPSGQY